MRRLLFATAVLAAACLCCADAIAAPVLLLESSGHAVLRQDRFVPSAVLYPSPPRSSAVRFGVATQTPGALKRSPRQHSTPERTVRGELARLHHTGQISRTDYRRYIASFAAALGTVRQLGGTRAHELQAVVSNLHDIAAAGLLVTSRLPALFLTLERNREWWSSGPLLAAGERVEFPGSELVWEYYPGQGIELQELGSFGKADGLYTAGRAEYGRLRHLLTELIALAAERNGDLTWEYYFRFDGGSPPWTSAISQGTALEALTRGYRALGNRSYLALARRALRIFSAEPPVGVGVRTQLGVRYVLYSFAPGTPVINGFLQALIGLFDYAHVSADASGWRLFSAGDAEARAELPSYDTGAWSLYQPHEEDTLDYHELVLGFLRELCTRTGAPPYCTTARHFQSYLKTVPVLRLLTHRIDRGGERSVRFSLSKRSHVGIVIAHGDHPVFLTSAEFSYGEHSFSVPAPAQSGAYTIRLAATDLAGNFNRILGTLVVG